MEKLFIFMGLCLAFSVEAKQSSQNIDVIKKQIIKHSIESYPGNYACPYHLASNGSRCGKRSAYHRAGGYTPICYPEDVTAQMMKEHKSRG